MSQSELAGGQVTLVDPMGNVSLIIQGNVRDLTPSTTYGVWVRDLTGYTGDYLNSMPRLGYFKLTTFTTNAKGHGNFHINIGKDDLPDGTYDIQVAINDHNATDPDISARPSSPLKNTPRSL